MSNTHTGMPVIAVKPVARIVQQYSTLEVYALSFPAGSEGIITILSCNSEIAPTTAQVCTPWGDSSHEPDSNGTLHDLAQRLVDLHLEELQAWNALSEHELACDRDALNELGL
ncbi:hypothetical protein [Deinococcus ruber]|uniref:Uncharacterized protein n=1 Tax=Deinococcus ruber TaxID=1848197 RepID=A0A918C6U5_9DEIO|nr:hypothetical protein [Deinococcus ruber]GGR09635.1 hypothetical protein GCM10008957_22970 [Deinococcus ruber]